MSRNMLQRLALLSVVMAVPALALAQAPAEKPAAAPLAIVDGVAITESDLHDHPQWGQFFALESQHYSARKQLVDDAIAKKLFEKEAAARGVTLEQLAQAEIASKTTPVSNEEMEAFYEQNKSRLANMPAAEGMTRVRDYLTQQSERTRRNEYVRELKTKSKVQILFDAPRMTVSVDDDPAKGPANAPITIVEFSDFQCPYCTRGEEVVKQIFARYGDSVRLVYRDLPLNIHPHAQKAAEAAHCAGDQGKYWELHGSMFAHQNELDPAGLDKQATAIGLDLAKFKACLDSGKYTAEVQKDAEEATKVGVTSTPAFFINGRLISGAQPIENFAAVIDQELERVGLPVPAAPRPAAAPKPAASPAAVAKPDAAPKADAPKPAASPRADTPKPAASPKPASSPKPAASPKPASSPKAETPKAAASPAPAASPASPAAPASPAPEVQ